MKTFDIFKPGKHVARSGDSINFSESDVQATIAAYDPAKLEAPIVVGHPKHDMPAYGWVKSLCFAEGTMCAEPHQVDPAFAEMVAAGRFKKVSASFYPPDSPSNPVPGVFYLRHVGFLGAQPPAVKGLRNPEFNDGDDKIVTIEFSEDSYAWSIISRMFRSVREYIIRKDGQEKADELLSNWDIDHLQSIANRPAVDGGNALPAFSEPTQTITPSKGEDMPDKDKAAALEAENKQLKERAAEFAERESRLAAAELAQRTAANVSFCEQLVTKGKLHPKQKDGAIAVMNALAADQTVEFSEPDGKKAEKPLVDAFKAFLSAQPKIVEFGEAGKPKGDLPNTAAIEFSQANVDKDRLDLHVRASALAVEKSIPYEQAARQLIQS